MSYTDYSSETDDASDTEVVMERYEDGNYLGINRWASIPNWIYHDETAKLDEEILQVREGTHSVCVAIATGIRKQFHEYCIEMRAYRDQKLMRINQEYIRRKEAILKDFEAAQAKIKEEIRAELKEKFKTLESEIFTKYKSASIETNTTSKKLQESPNDAASTPESRKRVLPSEMKRLLEELNNAFETSPQASSSSK